MHWIQRLRDVHDVIVNAVELYIIIGMLLPGNHPQTGLVRFFMFIKRYSRK